MPTRKRKKPLKFRKKNFKKKTFKKKTLKKNNFKKKTLKNKNLVKKYKMRGGKLVIPDDIPIQVVLENYKDNEKALELKNIDSKYNTVRAYIEPTNENTNNFVTELKNNEVNKTATIIEVGQGNKSFAMVRINYGPFYVASKHIINGNELYNIDGHPTVRVYDGDDSIIKYIGTPDIEPLYSIKNNCPIHIIKIIGSGNDSLTKIDLIVWVSIDHLDDPASTDQQEIAPAPPPPPPASSTSSPPNILSDSQPLENYAKIVDVYYPKFKPPEWVLEKRKNLLQYYGKHSIVLYTGGSLEDVRRLATEREPVNIAMERHYDKEKLYNYFGYNTGAYDELSNNGTTQPPQIAVACVTPVRYKDEERNVAVVNLIGMAFDNPQQPDYKLLIKDGKLDKDKLLKLMVNAYKMAFKAAELMNKSTLCCSPIGDVAFRPRDFYSTPEIFFNEVVEKAVIEANKSFPQVKRIWARYPEFNVPSAFFGKLPSQTKKWTEDLENRLFVNAWDCWTMLGNGNKGDNSADGFWGRSSAISLLGWPKSNPYIKYVEL
tara:strand:- start:1150 stop:2781 length:1632 start_codon:yes stop_codon:yes gene_type:complete